MNISPTQNVKLALQAVRTPLPLAAHGARHRDRHHHGGHRGFAVGRTARRCGHFFEQSGPDNVFVYKTSGDPSQEPPKERKRRPMKPEYAEFIRRWSSSVQDVGLQLYIPPGGGRQADHGARVGLRIGEHQRGGPVARTWSEISPRDFASGRYFHVGGGSALRARRDHWL